MLPFFRALVLLSIGAASLGSALPASAQPSTRPCVRNGQPLPPNYGGAPYAPAPCPTPPGYAPQPPYAPQPGYAPPPGYPPPDYMPQPGYPPPGYPPQPGYAPPGYPPQPGYAPPGYPPQPGYAPQPSAQQPSAQQPGYPPQPSAQQPAPPREPRCRARCCAECCSRRCAEDEDLEDTWLSVYMDLVSIRVGSYDVRGSDADARTWGFLFSMDPDIVTTSGYGTHRTTFYGAIGGGTDGFEGQLDWASRGGVRGYFGEDHGPFARAGLGLQLLGNNKLYRSQLELPTLEVGYQIHSEALLLELAGTGALVLGGRYFTGDDARRRIDTELEWGGLFTLQADYFRANAYFKRVEARQTRPGTPIDQLSAQLCVNPFGAVLLCADGAWHRGDVELPDGRVSESTALYLGGTLGIGVIKTGAAERLLD